jgi:hypothetical protein
MPLTTATISGLVTDPALVGISDLRRAKLTVRPATVGYLLTYAGGVVAGSTPVTIGADGTAVSGTLPTTDQAGVSPAGWQYEAILWTPSGEKHAFFDLTADTTWGDLPWGTSTAPVTPSQVSLAQAAQVAAQSSAAAAGVSASAAASSVASLNGLRPWAPATAYTAGDVRQAPDGSTVSRNTDGTSRGSFDATEQGLWTAVLAKSGTMEQAALNDTFAIAARDGSFAAVRDRVVFAPAGLLHFSWTFLPQGSQGQHYGAFIYKDTGTATYKLAALHADGLLGRVVFGEPIYSINGDDVYDCYLLEIPDDGWLLGFHSGDDGSIYIFKSTDHGATWAQTTKFSPGDPFTTHRRFSEVHMYRVPLGSAYTGTSDRIVAVWGDVDPVFPQTRPDAQYVTSYSDDGGLTWSATTIVTPTSGTATAGVMNDNTRGWLYLDNAGNTNLLYSRVQDNGSGTYVSSIWHTVLNQNGSAVVSTPMKVTDCTVNASTNNHRMGVAPSVFVGRDGKFHLVWGECNFDAGGSAGALFHMSGDGSQTGWGNKTTLITNNNSPNGYGRTQPLRVGGTLELFYGRVDSGTTSQLRALTLAGL